MKIKDAVEDRCPTCGSLRTTLEEEQYGCDYCKKIIDLEDNKYGNKESPHLSVTVFLIDRDETDRVDHLTFCSWKCLYSKIREYKHRTNIDFISFPYLSFKRDIRDKYCGDFFDCIKDNNADSR